MKKNRNIILGVTSSIAIYKACDVIRALRHESFLVTVVMTENAGKFITPKLFESLSANKVHQGLFDSPENWDIEHISLAEKAGLVLIAPASANIIAKIAGGICDDLLSCVVCATRAPVLMCPAMNENMYLNKITQGNIAKLKALGFKFVEPKKGELACGKVGTGCLADIEEIVKEVKRNI
ncbi:MAG: flavoprotein [Candidatus Omnitrophota bacterium]|nr:hypothetical protein [Candidatus Omnitrophota bacterium]